MCYGSLRVVSNTHLGIYIFQYIFISILRKKNVYKVKYSVYSSLYLNNLLLCTSIVVSLLPEIRFVSFPGYIFHRLDIYFKAGYCFTTEVSCNMKVNTLCNVCQFPTSLWSQYVTIMLHRNVFPITQFDLFQFY
jgi:hypothetical protein